MFKCKGNEYLSYSGQSVDLTGGIYLEFMIRVPSSTSPAGQNTIFAIQTSVFGTGTPFFRVAYDTTFQIYSEVLNDAGGWNRYTNNHPVEPGELVLYN